MSKKKNKKQPNNQANNTSTRQANSSSAHQANSSSAYEANKKFKKIFSQSNNKATAIVLIIAAIIFFAAVFKLHSEDILQGRSEIFDIYGDELVEFETATITDILSEEKKLDEIADNAYAGNQELSVRVKTGRYKGETMTVYNYFGPYYGCPLNKGDGVTLTIKTHKEGDHTATVYEFNRMPILLLIILLFFIAVAIVGGKTGIKSIVGLVFTVVCLFAILIPVLIKGYPTIPTTFLMCTYIALVSFTILGGVHRKTITAFLGTMAGTFVAMVFGMAAQYFAKIDGLRLEDAEALIQLKYAGATVQIRGLLVAGIIISALGAVMDVAMSISSSLEEVYAANPSLTRSELFKSGMNIGRDMAGTMTNTLILAFLGSEFSLMLFLYARELTFYHLFSTAFVSLETISGISSSIGLVMAIPLTAFIAATLITRQKK